MRITKLRLTKLLSFIDTTVELKDLNVIIGANAAGKSNLIEAIGLLQAAPTNIAAAILRGGGVRQWRWLGDADPAIAPGIECELRSTDDERRERPILPEDLVYSMSFSESGASFEILREALGNSNDPKAYLSRDSGRAKYGAALAPMHSGKPGDFKLESGESLLSQIRDPNDPTPITSVGKHFAGTRIAREFRTGPQSQARLGVSAAAPIEFLTEGAENLAQVLNQIDFHDNHPLIMRYIARFCDRFQDVKISVSEGLARIFLKETGLREMVSAMRMSDGTLKFLAILALLFHPTPPPLICLEEPELGLHPDAMRLVAEALVEASEKTQIIVTTHSEALVDALTGTPESVLVCERDFDNGTQFRRLSKDKLGDWLERYTLGELWRKGEIGGNPY